MRLLTLSALVLASVALVSCDSPSKKPVAGRSGSIQSSATRINSVRTTAYTHSEADHVRYGTASAAGDHLKYGRVRSAATDWSVYPVGTVFQIDGDPYVYEVDDYGSALVGTNTIDLYKPDKQEMRNWGVRSVNIRVLRWGSFSKSLAIMRERTRNDHVRKMVQRIERSS
ncbi:MAG: 3D domain-containing protein [Verrucomicrobiaceae bacterium]|nr:3D domain-containing protein [Verrucomicrobiaceae bacterium]